jgi:hypothetical protein
VFSDVRVERQLEATEYQPKIPWSNDSRTEITVYVSLRALRRRLRSPESEKKNAVLSGDLARITRKQWRTKCRRRPRRGAESLLSSHAVDSVGVERRVSPAPRRSGASPFLESFDREVTV